MKERDYLSVYSIKYALDEWKHFLNKNPEAIVLSDSLGWNLSRREVDEKSGKIYTWLLSQNIGKDDFILINLDRGVKPVVAVLGVLKAGAAFTIVESTYAPERVAFIKKDCNATIEIDEKTWPEIMAMEYRQGFEQVNDHDICMAVYTTGTTGTPKGVFHEYGQLKMEMLSEQNKNGSWRENEKTRWGLVAPLNFVASLKIVVHFLYCGGHLYVLDYDTVKNSKLLKSYFLKNKINETFLSPSLLRIRKNGFGPFMKYIYTGAEPANHVFIKGLELNNTYTMSESFFTVSEFIIDKPYAVCPIGNPKFDLDIRLIDENGQDVPDGKRGEFCFYNPYCRGYIQNNKENAIHFIDGWFHTGDLAVYKNGKYYLKGRQDDMIKIDGNRIEPSEIEAACLKVLKINECVAKGFTDKGAVVVYYTGAATVDTSDAQKKLQDYLPYYMIPAFFVKLDKIPLNKSAKTERKALAFPAIIRHKIYVAPRNDIEKKISLAMERTLEISKIGIDDDFFELGGNSIKAIETVDLLGKYFSHQFVTTSLIYEGRTIRNMMEILNCMAEDISSEEKEALRRDMLTPLRHFSAVIYPVLKAFPEATTFNLYGGFRFKKNLIMRASRLAKAVNNTICNNSQLQTVIKENTEGVPCWVYAPECYPEVQVEKMSDQEALKVANTFVRGFDQMDQRLYRMRLIESKHFIYLYSDFSHVLFNGGALTLLAQDITAAFLGKVNTGNRFYEWLYDLEKTLKSERYKKADKYFNQKYLSYIDNLHFINKGEDGSKYIKKMYELNFDSAILKEHKRIYHISNSLFINAVFLCAMSIFNHLKHAGIMWAYNGLEGKKNHCGFVSKAFPLVLSSETYSNLNEFYEDIKQQVNQELRRGYYFFDYDSTFAAKTTQLNINIDYLGDMESMDQLEAIGAEEIDMTSPHDTDIESNYIIAQILDSPKGFDLRLWHPVSELTENNAKEFVKIVRSVIYELLSGNLPVFLRSDEESEG